MNVQDRETLAGEHALGLLTPEEAASVERAMVSDPALAAAVGRWRDRLNEIDQTAGSAVASHELWRRIEDALDAAPAQPTRKEPRSARWARTWESIAFWRAVGLAGAAAAAGLAAALAFVGLSPRPEPLVIAVLANADMTPGAIVEVYPDNSAKLIPIADVAVPDGRALQVWTLPDPATGPVSIGLLGALQQARLAPAPLPRPKARQLYEITLEPVKGSPTGRPTGPILYKGYAEAPR